MSIKPFYQKCKVIFWILITIIVLVFIFFSLFYFAYLPIVRPFIQGFCQGTISYIPEEDWNYKPQIILPDKECDFTGIEGDGSYYLDLDVKEFEETKSKMEEIITSYGGEPQIDEAPQYYENYEVDSVTITAEIPVSKANTFVKEMRKFTVSPNIVYSDNLQLRDKKKLKEDCKTILSNIQWYIEKEKLDLFILNNMTSINESGLKMALDDISQNRQDADAKIEEFNNLFESSASLYISIYIQEIAPAEE